MQEAHARHEKLLETAKLLEWKTIWGRKWEGDKLQIQLMNMVPNIIIKVNIKKIMDKERL